MATTLSVERIHYKPLTPQSLSNNSNYDYILKKENLDPLSGPIARIFPSLTSIQPSVIQRSNLNSNSNNKILKIGVVLSGGPAAGGHNVIAGLFHHLKHLNKNNILYGFKGGPIGIINCDYIEITSERLLRFQNQGGFDIISTGRDKIESQQQFKDSLKSCKQLNLNGLVVIGGDDSNTNAALLAEYFYEHGINVIGCPKTIDGDLKNEKVQCSFGFDTATKVYSELIGNIMSDARSSLKYYHFIRLMGRSASHIALECALKTHPNIVIIGEEIASKKRTLSQITNMICDIIVERAKKDINYGVILVPEGLIEFIPEISHLIDELNTLLAKDIPPERVREKCSSNSRELFDFLPKGIQHQLVLERDPHGNVQVSKIQTEKLLIDLVSIELNKRKQSKEYNGKFNAMNHFFGYEGRCALPSNFDCNYCYSLGKTAGILLEKNETGVMATIGNLHLSIDKWIPGGYPLIRMMNMERRKGKMVPVIRKALVELGDKPFQVYKQNRIKWALENHYVSPGPIQFYGPTSNQTTITLLLENGGNYKEQELDIILSSKL